jgi:Domain of unknown function (DUF3479)
LCCTVVTMARQSKAQRRSRKAQLLQLALCSVLSSSVDAFAPMAASRAAAASRAVSASASSSWTGSSSMQAAVASSRSRSNSVQRSMSMVATAERTGMFTNSNPEDRRVTPASREGKAFFKVTYVVLESQYQASLTKACQTINSERDDVCVECVGYLLEELRDDKNLAAFQKDCSESNIFIGSLIFVQELAEKVAAVVEPLRDQLDAVVVFPSMPEVMRYNIFPRYLSLYTLKYAYTDPKLLSQHSTASALHCKLYAQAKSCTLQHMPHLSQPNIPHQI